MTNPKLILLGAVTMFIGCTAPNPDFVIGAPAPVAPSYVASEKLPDLGATSDLDIRQDLGVQQDLVIRYDVSTDMAQAPSPDLMKPLDLAPTADLSPPNRTDGGVCPPLQAACVHDQDCCPAWNYHVLCRPGPSDDPINQPAPKQCLLDVNQPCLRDLDCVSFWCFKGFCHF